MATKEPTNELEIWTIYDKPKDYPNNFVARKEIISEGKRRWADEFMVSNKLENIQDYMKRQFLFRIPRNEDDDPKIVECWL